jgi:hypothetical protein
VDGPENLDLGRGDAGEGNGVPGVAAESEKAVEKLHSYLLG